ncbi:TonB-dependent receptor domain-containing protein [Shewanella saliphila]|uniref:Ligand-gated channel n=1 Tax=Shewanella saliphila TaxID=2282698 RepID=A0ABQ2Q9F9_9GAMM|nr:TonB-dependent receptor [Shewanella saliphila]MCL1101849.1 TonB-dependent receptor [Shewanella saliphila]GGP59396.1 ligand-gated channel [Shewanella saliphila]
MYRKTYLAFVISAFFIAPQAFSAEDNKVDDESIEKITVWSTQVKTSSLYMSGDAIASKQADHISDLLRTIPGVDVGGAHSLNQRITIRSLDDKDLNISIDGATQNSYMYHHMGNLQIHADILKSVDIDVGTNSVVDGGLGGSVRFETKQARDLLKSGQSFGARAQFSAGDNSGSNYSLTGYGVLAEDYDFLAYYNAVQRDNYEVGGGKITDADGVLIPNTDGKVRGLEGDIDDALIKFGWNINDNQRLSVSYENYKDEGDYSYRPDMGLATDIAITDSLGVPLLWPTEFTRETVTLNYEILWGESSQLKTAIFSNTSELWRDESGYAENPSFASSAGIITGEAKNTGLSLLGESMLTTGNIEHDFTYGADIVKYETDYLADYNTSPSETSAEQAIDSAIYIQDRITIGDFSIIPGVRYNNYDVESTVVTDVYNNTSFALAAEYQPMDELVFKLSATELFKGPEIGEVFVGAGLYDTVNPNIEAETGVNTEVAFAYQDSVLGADAFSIGATLFHTQIEDYIYDYAGIPPNGDQGDWKDNVGDMEIEGYEIYLGYEKYGLNGLITYSSSRSDLKAFDDYEVLDGARIDREQGNTISANINYVFDSINLTLNWDILVVDDLDAGTDLDGATADNAKDGFTVQNIAASWVPEFAPDLTVIVGVDNLFDEYYASQSSRTGKSFHPRFGDLYLTDYEPGRNIKATLSYQF